MKPYSLANRDLSWLAFNKQVLCEARATDIPIKQKINFLAIFSSNLDEFYQVRYPVVQLLAQSFGDSDTERGPEKIKDKIDKEIDRQQNLMGRILREIKKDLIMKGIAWIYDKKIPAILREEVAEVFRNEVLGKLQLIGSQSSHIKEVFAPNAQIFLALYHPEKQSETVFIPIPTTSLPRFIKFKKGKKTYVIFLEDLIKSELVKYRSELKGFQGYTFKVNRNAEMNLEDEDTPRLAKRIKKEINRRENGNPTRLLYQREMPQTLLKDIQHKFRLESANMVEGGTYHQLKDLFSFPLSSNPLDFWKVIEPDLGSEIYFLEEIFKKDVLIHPPYHSFFPVLRLFNEAAIHPEVKEIFLTIYRVAKDSKILQSLITAALNGKKVTVFVELKARFDEENNLDWAEKMKAVGIRIKYSIPKLKVHAKAALIKLKKGNKIQKIALLGTGNFNESTAKVYTDHFLFTSEKKVCRDLEEVFNLLMKSPQKPKKGETDFSILWVGKLNLKEKILDMIEVEIQAALAGRKAEIFLKLNNLEEEDVILALYKASQSGVNIRLLIRGICRLIPGIKGQSERIIVKRIVDHYLEHGRIFSFHAEGKKTIYMGSADWMDRNLSRRIEICFPILDSKLRFETLAMLETNWKDNVKAQVFPKERQDYSVGPFRSQPAICKFLNGEKG